MDEIGSGVRNITKYYKIYLGEEPIFIESVIFKTIIPLANNVSGQVSGEVSGNERIEEILKYCKEPGSRNDIQTYLNIRSRRYISEKILEPLVKGELLKLTIPDKPKSPKQRYHR